MLHNLPRFNFDQVQAISLYGLDLDLIHIPNQGIFGVQDRDYRVIRKKFGDWPGSGISVFGPLTLF